MEERMRHLVSHKRPLVLFALLVLVAVLAVINCHDSVSLPPIKGPPLKIPEGRGATLTPAPKTLEVIHISPKGQLTSPHLQIAVSFNKPMVDLTKVEERAAKSPIEFVGHEVRGKQRWLGSRTLTFRPDEPLAGSTTYAMKIPAGLRSADGTKLEKEVSWSFTTPRLKVSRAYPGNGRRWVKPDQRISLYFNQPVKPATLEQNVAFVVRPGEGATKTAGEQMTIAAKVRQGKNSKHMVLHAAAPFPKGAKVTLKVDKKLTGVVGPLAMDRDYSTYFYIYGPLRVLSISCQRDCDPEDSIRVRFSNPVKVRAARMAISLNGRKIKAGRSTYSTSSLYLNERFKPRRRYTIKVAAKLRDKFGQQLQPTKVPLSFSTGDYDPYVSLPIESGVLEAGGPKRLPLYFRNATEATLLTKRMGPAEVARLVGHSDYWDQSNLLLDDFSGVRKQKLKVAVRPNRRVTRRVDLGRLVKGKGRGTLALELDTNLRYRRGKERRIRRVLVRITDLAITAKYSPHSTLFWVTSLASGKPVGGAKVSIWRPGGKAALWSGTADAGGLAMAPGANKLGGGKGERRNFLFFAQKGDDESFVISSTQSGISPWDFGLDGTWEDRSSSLIGMLFSDRGIYRPGDEVQIKGVLRRAGPKGLIKLSDANLELVVTDSRGEEIMQDKPRLTEFGSFHTKVKLPAGAPLGSYSVVAKPGSGGTAYGRFSVEEYRPAEFKVTVKTDRRQYVRGDKMTWDASAAYLFGAPMRSSKFRWWASYSRSGFQPPEHDGYVFSDGVKWWQGSRSSSGSLAQGQGRLSAEGKSTKGLILKPTTMDGPRGYEVEATVTDVSRQTISNRTRVLLHPGEFYIGAKPKETFITAGTAVEAQVVAAAPKGKHLTGEAIRGTLYRRTWHSVRKQGMGGAHYFVTRHKDTPAGTCTVTSAAKPRPCKITAKLAGYHYLRLQGKDKRGNPLSTSFGIYVSGADYVPWRRDNESRLELVTDRKSYKVGQVARILVKSPFSGAHGLFTVERNGIVTRKAIKLKRTSAWLTVPITKDLIPNAFVSVMLVRGRIAAPKKGKKGAGEEEDPGKPAFKVGYAKLSIDQTSKKLKVQVKPGRAEYRPGEEVTVDLSVKDSRGTPMRAELTVFVADEGVLSLVGYKTPNPMSIFYAERGLSVRTADNRIKLISRRVFGQKGNKPGGGGGEAGAAGPGGMRRNFVSTPYFNPAVITDAGGKARITFKLPDNLTTFRIMAVATSAEAEFGHAQDQVKVNKPLLMLPTLPRLVRVGDRIEAGVVIHNHAKRGGQVKISVQAKGIELTGPASQSVRVGKGDSAEARFAFRATTPGEALFRFSAKLDDFQDGLELKLPVKLPLVMEAVATYGSTDSVVAEGVVPSSGIRTDVGGLEVTTASTALVGLKTGMEYLLDYPYECAEQTTSRLVPLVMLTELSEGFALKTPAEARPLAAKLIARLEKLQRWNGGFSYWASSYRAYPWASAYAAWGLKQAKNNGHRVGKRTLDRARSYLKGFLRKRAPKEKLNAQIHLNTMAYLLYVLTELGEKPTGYITKLYEQREELAVFAKALLLSAAIKVKGDKKMIETLTQEVLNQVHQTGKLAKVEENLGDGYAPLFHSDLRSTAMTLDALLKSKPEHPLVEKLVRYLLESRKEGRWRNTQETVYSLLGLQSYYKIREKAVPDFLAHVVLGDKTLFKKRFKGRSLKAHEVKVPMKQLTSKGQLGFIKQGTGRLYYSARLRYARAKLPDKPWDEGFYVTRTYEPVSRDVTSFNALRGDPHKQSAGSLKVKAGDLVRVTLRIVVPQHSHFVVVDDPLPAGLEAVNFKLMTASRSVRRNMGSFSGFQPGHSHKRHRSSWYTPFYHREIRDDRVMLFADDVMPGVHSYVYLARATTIGSFVAAPTHVEQMYEPEVFGRTGAKTFVVEAK
jgi:uncharacterized protein YfaS (alpha-2-macroglobulin family)